MTIHGYNAGTAPIPYAYLLVPTDKNDNAGGSMKELAPKWDGKEFIFSSDDAVRPSESVTLAYDYDANPDHSKFFVRFSDSRGKIWHRAINSGRYLNKRAAAKALQDYLQSQ
ncbi:hypothetical protein QN355_11690 [Cryobacterium sp. 10S3]|uniref:hypothetical protein n=1 Tax=Cryobacterium sp. 10S3 TaxID=3048582 RepID=UPI002B237FB2|nr:hypothetical protein [Cryobacterium sp. 10S3]MEB0287216.1 hypothetical protein [Cryobacterium sp. 10S3]